ncbi:MULTISPECIES: hypothetical protein [unclassified Martelella]|uniref:hypothetical protein n=1 Tax=unclassified Martelella TaxID=2629616 RepID=UPI0025BED2BB|nr:hypothetical protein [Martelella sp.]
MASNPKFGFSAFLRILHQNERPQYRTIKERYREDSSGGYDFHRSFRNRVQSLADGTLDENAITDSVNSIRKTAERRSTLDGLKAFVAWKRRLGLILLPGKPILYSPKELSFSLEFKPDFITLIDGELHSVHLWNTKTPLTSTITMSTLKVVSDHVRGDANYPKHLAVYALKQDRIYSTAFCTEEHLILGRKLLLNVDALSRKAVDEIRQDKRDSPPPLHPSA